CPHSPASLPAAPSTRAVPGRAPVFVTPDPCRSCARSADDWLPATVRRTSSRRPNMVSDFTGSARGENPSGSEAGAAANGVTPLLRVRGLCKHFPIRSNGFTRRVVGHVKAVDDINFDLMPGETLGIVGESGSGKTTMARCLLRAVTPTAGSVDFRKDGRTVDLAALPESALRDLRPHMQMIFQDPFSSLNPRMTVGEIVGEPLMVHRLA